MQQVTSQPQSNPNFRAGGNSRSTTIIILALLLFALSGLMTGFATGAFTRPKPTSQTQTNKGKPGVPPTATHKQTPIANATATPEVTKLSPPFVTHYDLSEMADGTTNYTVSAYPVDQQTGKQPHIADITCKVWLTKDEKATATLIGKQDTLRSIDTVSGVLPTEIDNGLNFVSTQQTQMCSANSPTSWTYTIPPSIDHGKYFLMVLTDWKGNAYNWFALQVNVKKAS